MFDKIEKLCKEKNVSISKLEKTCNLGNGTIRNWKNSTPSVENLKKVADYFQVPVTYFLENDSEE